MACDKGEREMLQLELYVADAEATARTFCALFGMSAIEEKAGWRHLRHEAGFDIMLFEPASNLEGESHWPMPPPGTGGKGIEIVICMRDAAGRRLAALALGFECSGLRRPPWGSTEFLFRLPEGYLIRVKQPPGL